MKKSACHAFRLSLVFALLVTACEFPGTGPEPPCGESVLEIGNTTYQIQEIKTKADGSLKIPSNSPGIAYWIDQTKTNHVFALSAEAENFILQNDPPEQAILTWENCNSSTYTLSAPQAGVPDMNTLLDQSFSGVTIFVQDDNSGFFIRGEFIGEEIQAFDTPDPSEMLAEISLLETVPSADKTTIKVSVSILNYGKSNIALTSSDVSLLIGDSTTTPLNSEPALPKEISPGTTERLSFTFAYPNVPGATLKVFSAEYELEY